MRNVFPRVACRLFGKVGKSAICRLSASPNFADLPAVRKPRQVGKVGKSAVGSASRQVHGELTDFEWLVEFVL